MSYIVEHGNLSQKEARAAARQNPNPLRDWDISECIRYRQPNLAREVQETDVRETKSCDVVMRSAVVSSNSTPGMPVVSDALPSNSSVQDDRGASSLSLEDIDGSKFEVQDEKPTTTADMSCAENTMTTSTSDYQLPSNTDDASDNGSRALSCLFLASCLSIVNPDTLDSSFSDESDEDPRNSQAWT